MCSDRVNAVYSESPIKSYRGNPFIEALPKINDWVDDLNALKGPLSCAAEELSSSGVSRAHNICGIVYSFFQPLSHHVQLYERLSIMIRAGYVGRNPNSGEWVKHIQNGYERIMSGDLAAFKFSDVSSTAQSMTLIGCSGGGKTTAVSQLLSLYPQVIYHEKLNIEQVVYLKVDCSHDGSLKELCNNFFRSMDIALKTSNYAKRFSAKRNSVEASLANMAHVANVHALGVVVIDEIQHLDKAKSGGSEKMLNFFVTLVNTIGLPVILVGTPRARTIFEVDMRSARRGSGFGSIFWDPMPTGKEWEALTNKLWSLQWLQKRDELISDEIRELWYDLSQGVLDIVIKLFVLSQLRAIATRTERLTPKLMQQVYDDEFKTVHPMLSALKSGDADKIAEFSDLQLKDTDKRLLAITHSIDKALSNSPDENIFEKLRSEGEKRVYLALKDEHDSKLLIPVIQSIFDQHPEASWVKLLPIIYEHLLKPSKNIEPESKKMTTRSGAEKQKDWHTLNSEDLRFVYSQGNEVEELINNLEKQQLIFDIQDWLESAV